MLVITITTLSSSDAQSITDAVKQIAVFRTDEHVLCKSGEVKITVKGGGYQCARRRGQKYV